MARYTYNASLVTQAVDKLCSACDALDNTNVDMQKGISTIYNARGAENINVDFSVITGYQSQVVECIDTMTEEIRNKAQEIEEYQDAPWYKKLFATIGMGALKLVEGLATFVENIGDGLVSIAGFIGGIFSSEFKDSVAEFVKTDYVGDAFAEAYEEGWLSDVNKYSIMSHESTAANVLKGIGVAAGYVVLSVATAGAGTAVSLGVSTVAAGVGGIGSGTQSGLQAGMTFNQAFGEGVKQGAVAAGTTLLVGSLANKLGSLAKGAGAIDDAGAVLASSGDDVATALATTGDDIINVGDDVLRIAGGASDDIINSADDVLRNATSFADDIANNLDDGAKIVGKAITESGDEIVVVQNAAGQTGAFIKTGDQVGRLLTDNIDDIASAVAKNGGVYDDIGGLLTNIDDVANAGSQGLAVIDDVANAGSQGLAVIDDVANAGSQGLAVIDDVANAGSQGLAVIDDVANAGSQGLAVIDDVANAGSQGLAVIDDVANTADDVVNATKQNIVQKIAGKVDQTITNFGTNTKLGQTLANAAANAGPTVTNAVAAGTGAVVTGAITDPIETSAYRVEMNTPVTPGETLVTEATAALENGIPTGATEAEAAQNLQNLQEQGYNPGAETQTPTVTDTSGTGTTTITAPTTDPTTYNPTESTSTTSTVSTPTVTLPEYDTNPTVTPSVTVTTPSVTITTPDITTPSVTTPTVTTPTTVTPEDIIGGVTLPDITTPTVTPDTQPSTTTPSIGGVTGTQNPGGITSTTGTTGGSSSLVGSEVLDTFGDVSGSFAGIVGNDKTSIPTSSAPILSGDGTTSKSMIPLGAGLGAAALAGIGTKAYLDKKSKNQEEEDNIDTEEWEEDADSVEIDYGQETNEEADYLSPTDEYAFQE